MAEQHQPRFFKLMNSKYADRFLGGQVKFGTIDEYRGHKDLRSSIQSLWQAAMPPRENIPHSMFVKHMEGLGKKVHEEAPQGIEDVWEGVDCYDIEPSADKRSFGNVVSTVLPNRALFCGSRELNVQVVNTMRAASLRHGGQEYNVCVPIVDLGGFFNALTSALARHFGINGPVKAFVGEVVYAPKRMPTSVFAAPEGSGPFPKASEVSGSTGDSLSA